MGIMAMVSPQCLAETWRGPCSKSVTTVDELR
ncbi:hypothetical protein DFJ69_3369 [Thermomonospora umbrina]|uniref:Uncharacterized protein n=1 Tax=Thermomonospora umbrina TaxID=111806 RepID=A0A3D9SPK1_9ACTN|nr:hypothetical protein DFJ69_3369 [Thermomonospora umbrina]